MVLLSLLFFYERPKERVVRVRFTELKLKKKKSHHAPNTVKFFTHIITPKPHISPLSKALLLAPFDK